MELSNGRRDGQLISRAVLRMMMELKHHIVQRNGYKYPALEWVFGPNLAEIARYSRFEPLRSVVAGLSHSSSWSQAKRKEFFVSTTLRAATEEGASLPIKMLMPPHVAGAEYNHIICRSVASHAEALIVFIFAKEILGASQEEIASVVKDSVPAPVFNLIQLELLEDPSLETTAVNMIGCMRSMGKQTKRQQEWEAAIARAAATAPAPPRPPPRPAGPLLDSRSPGATATGHRFATSRVVPPAAPAAGATPPHAGAGRSQSPGVSLPSSRRSSFDSQYDGSHLKRLSQSSNVSKYVQAPNVAFSKSGAPFARAEGRQDFIGAQRLNPETSYRQLGRDRAPDGNVIFRRTSGAAAPAVPDPGKDPGTRK